MAYLFLSLSCTMVGTPAAIDVADIPGRGGSVRSRVHIRRPHPVAAPEATGFAFHPPSSPSACTLQYQTVRYSLIRQPLTLLQGGDGCLKVCVRRPHPLAAAQATYSAMYPPWSPSACTLHCASNCLTEEHTCLTSWQQRNDIAIALWCSTEMVC